MKPSIPKGTRDFSPVEMLRRRYIFDTVRKVFELHGFMPIETPSMENLSTLLGKYGDEGDKLLFKVLNSGDFLSSLTADDLAEGNSNRSALKISDKGLRYDLTVPFARYVVQHQSEIAFPFKRYQIQPVWRADRPQKGRYREFFQCDVDVVGSDSLLNEVELVQIVAEVFAELGIFVTLKMNNRKILYGIAETIGHLDKMVDITVAIDKLEKIGMEAVEAELTGKGLDKTAIEALRPILELTGSNAEKIASLRKVLASSSVARPIVGSRSKLLYRRHIRGESQGFPDRKHLRWRPLRRSYRYIRSKRSVWRGNIVRRRPHIRRVARARPLSQGGDGRFVEGALRQLRRRG